ncbi:MAG: GNAT family N-acetyltransferase [bacterium]
MDTQSSVALEIINRGDVAPWILQGWQRMLQKSKSLFTMYQSPEWWDHLDAKCNDSELCLIIAKNIKGELIGVLPLQVTTHVLNFMLGRFLLMRLSLKSAIVLGGQPLLSEYGDVYGHLFNFVWSALPDCNAIYMKSVPRESSAWQFFVSCHWQSNDYFIYRPDGVRTFHSVNLPSTFNEYISKFSKKKRYNLKRQVRLLREHFDGKLNLICVDSDHAVDEFVDGMESVTSHAWQYRQKILKLSDLTMKKKELKDLALRGLLRSYLLKCGDHYSAFVLGYQFQEIFHYSDISYDERLARFSPGNVMLYMLIEDLISRKPPQWINFGIGDSEYKRQFGNCLSEDTDILLLRKTFLNRLRLGTHMTFRKSLKCAKFLLRRKISDLF